MVFWLLWILTLPLDMIQRLWQFPVTHKYNTDFLIVENAVISALSLQFRKASKTPSEIKNKICFILTLFLLGHLWNLEFFRTWSDKDVHNVQIHIISLVCPNLIIYKPLHINCLRQIPACLYMLFCFIACFFLNWLHFNKE